MSTEDTLTLLPKELDRLIVVERFKKGDITQEEAASILSLSTRQTRRLIRRYESQGPLGMVSQQVGKKPSNAFSEDVKQKAIQLIKEHFYDYGPTLAAEKLSEYFELEMSKETVRSWMIDANLWVAHVKKEARIHPPRPRRPLFGELIQMDGSYHRWFEGRGPKCCLIVFIDDATSRLMKLQFTQGETTLDYMGVLKDYVLTYGVPRAAYFDKHCVFRVNLPNAATVDGDTQFGRVLKTLKVQAIYAHSPQAKGRVERVNATLQDRLIKEMRFFNINDMASGNAFLDGFMARHNKRFSKPAERAEDAHRRLTDGEREWLDYIFSIHTERKVSKDMIVRHNKTRLTIKPPLNRPRRIANQKVIVCENVEGMKIYYRDEMLDFTHEKRGSVSPELSRKTLEQYMDQYQDQSFDFASYWKHHS